MSREAVAAALTEFVGRKAGKNYSLVCTVKTIDLTAKTCYCEPLDDSADIQQVRLIAEKTKDGFILIPKLESLVVVTFLSESSAYVSMVSQVDEIHLAGINYGGLAKTLEITDKLNNIEDKINDLITAITGWTPVANDGGAALKLALSTWLASSLVPTTMNDITSDTVLHGDGT